MSMVAETLPVLLASANREGHPEIDHETIALVWVVHEHLTAGNPDQDWERFRAQHRGLFDRQLLTRYYPSDVCRARARDQQA
ncbi:MAG: hypothetical protein ACI89X_003349 [Planctomycetota bacterium]|jgi:hypothetical protein